MIVQFVNQQTKYPVKAWKDLLRRVLAAALVMLPFSHEVGSRGIEIELSVIFAGPNVMRRVNRETRGVDRLTDVLSFPVLDMSDGKLNQPLQDQDFDLARERHQDGVSHPVLPIGEILISLDQAFEQAADYGHSDEREIAFLAVHGLLHLAGFDHLTDKQEKAMVRRQQEILRQLGLERHDQPKSTSEDKHHE
jgi:rRNA maturation RNase YbeY